MFSDGRMLTKCVGYDLPAMCGMYPMPHPETGDPIMTCTGPIIAYTEKSGVFSTGIERRPLTPHDGCPYHPARINEPHNDSSSLEEVDWM